ncbi:hypothetical protein QWY82_02065 [Simiduia curdlanivorans]|uniref:Uncharacterized protein n=1 Tax=Simiduia curdlanivorans TaxID=1492769 RepID=A0ABV8V3G2_9GAMM|nr:hypothetical protein [Simiduia curdlanivorans]MDN3637583.1 hypothetical protein [Simiduia curdlanivorans]
MNEHLKKEIESSIEKMRAIKASTLEAASRAESKAKSFWHDTEQQLNHIEAKLTSAKASLNTSTDEAILQAHLAAMEASEHWGRIKDTVESTLLHSKQAAKTELDYTVLKAHLAKMDAQKFLEEDGKAFIKKFNQSRENVSKEVSSAIALMGKNMDKVASHMRRDV